MLEIEKLDELNFNSSSPEIIFDPLRRHRYTYKGAYLLSSSIFKYFAVFNILMYIYLYIRILLIL